jgi:hypothetical protein
MLSPLVSIVSSTPIRPPSGVVDRFSLLAANTPDKIGGLSALPGNVPDGVDHFSGLPEKMPYNVDHSPRLHEDQPPQRRPSLGAPLQCTRRADLSRRWEEEGGGHGGVWLHSYIRLLFGEVLGFLQTVDILGLTL